MTCLWCNEQNVKEMKHTVYWELPAGDRAIIILETPSLHCENCQMVYQDDQFVEGIEDQLMLIDTSKLPSQISYQELMSRPRWLKRNYFR
ncbi:hypothetical protein AZF04_00250 [Alkalihalobacillus trypoxylicola]|uniref:YokU family protein n=2 Tax=Alkalihalobacillus trypoxylicola TaxID=519424 RepID=A0A162FCW5_9BACI|nr:YokU family protein [Alkalihalobacillus trypoxylicola]KYG35319.1 hypothetical protein AZF04_00250 [Alkalihalobacillus trypoxylicola]